MRLPRGRDHPLPSHSRVRRLLVCCTVIALTMVSVSCSGDDGSSGASADNSSDPTAPTGSESEMPARETEPDDSTGASSATSSTVAVSTTVSETIELSLDEDEAACVADRMAADPALTERDAVEDCAQLLVFGPQLAAGLREDFPGVYSDEQLTCLVGAYAALSPEDGQLLVSGGLNPGSDDEAAARVVLEDLFVGCEAPLPPALAE